MLREPVQSSTSQRNVAPAKGTPGKDRVTSAKGTIAEGALSRGTPAGQGAEVEVPQISLPTHQIKEMETPVANLLAAQVHAKSQGGVGPHPTPRNTPTKRTTPSTPRPAEGNSMAGVGHGKKKKG